MSPLALAGLHKGDESEEAKEGERLEQSPYADSDSEDEEAKEEEERLVQSDSEGENSEEDIHVDHQRELEDVKCWASFSSSLCRIYVCHACDDSYNEMGPKTFGRSFVLFRDSPNAEWRRETLELGGSGYHRALARSPGEERWGKGIKRKDRDVFDRAGLGFPGSEHDGWPLE